MCVWGGVDWSKWGVWRHSRKKKTDRALNSSCFFILTVRWRQPTSCVEGEMQRLLMQEAEDLAGEGSDDGGGGAALFCQQWRGTEAPASG